MNKTIKAVIVGINIAKKDVLKIYLLGFHNILSRKDLFEIINPIVTKSGDTIVAANPNFALKLFKSFVIKIVKICSVQLTKNTTQQ